jgi:DNA polymerase elongation subunit (family B)
LSAEQGAKVLLVDIETAPLVSWNWGVYEQNAIDVKTSWYMLSFAAKWLGDKKVKTWALPDYSNYKKNKEDDSALVGELWKLYDTADVVVAHNGDRFDIKKSNARFIKHGFKPPAPYKQIDTLKVARARFAFTSNRLNDLAKYLQIGQKLPHTGFHLWQGCMTGDAKSWALMRKYNAHDVELLEQVYLRIRPWMTNHPDLTLYGDKIGCPSCQSSKIQRRGFNVARSRRTPRFQCMDCGGWWAGKVA